MPEGPKSDEWTEKLEVSQCMSLGRSVYHLTSLVLTDSPGIGVSQRMDSSYAARHVDVGVSLCMSLCHASGHVCPMCRRTCDQKHAG
ncbi:hypothetical protein F2Q69_00013737 [Brassica cretica]|uniref:Uncharacterized protein n=1 Tax=Brassica cretica TaxID=69181 RepID=A0A8S9QUP5_BRACR|nr:hypothetical protein F2Q69_00013737 [Brassica cretica]